MTAQEIFIFESGIWFAVDYLVRYCDLPSAAVEICNEANISRNAARSLWRFTELSGCDNENLMIRFLDYENFKREK